MTFRAAVCWVLTVALGILVIFLLVANGYAQGRHTPCVWVTDEECVPSRSQNWVTDDSCDARSRRAPAPRGSRRGRDWPPVDASESRSGRGWQSAPAVDRTPARPAAGGITVHAVLCGVPRDRWAATVQRASGIVVASGGRPFLIGQTVEGCPRSFEDLARVRLPAGGLYFGVYGQGQPVRDICGGAAVGCAEMGGSLGFAAIGGAWWNPITIAHEAGHMFGLDHSREPDDLMAPSHMDANVFASDAYLRAQARWRGGSAAYRGPRRIVR